MLTVTDAALERLLNALKEVAAVKNTCFRFTQEGDEGVRLVVQEPESSDKTFELEGETVLAAPESVAGLLSAKVLDLDDDGRLVLLPQAA